MAIEIREYINVANAYRKFDVYFFDTRILTIVTSSAVVVRIWLRSILHFRRLQLRKLVVGLGVQWIPNDNEAATLQICVGRRCLIFQLMNSETVPKSLRSFLEHPDYTFVGLWNHSDADKLKGSRHGLRMPRQPLDLRVHALSKRGKSLAKASVETIVRLEKRICMSNWSVPRLRDEQILQACIDAYVSFEIGKRIKAWKIEDY